MLTKKTYKKPKLNRYGTVETLTQNYSSFYGQAMGKKHGGGLPPWAGGS